MKQQMQMIEVTETPTGKYHFDVPKGGGHSKQKKDLYTAFMLAGRCVYDHYWSEMLPESILHHGGVLKPRDERPTFASETLQGYPPDGVPEALRDKLEMAEDPEAFRQKLLRRTFRKRTLLTSPSAVLKPMPKKSGR
jgi:hypothetical protein